MSVAGAAAGGVIAGLLIANNVKRTTDGITAAQDAWGAVDGLELVTEPVEGASKKTTGAERPELRGSIGGCDVRVRIVSDIVHYAHTEIVATPSGGQGLKGIEVGVHPSPRGMLGRVRSWLGQDIEVGDEAFDEAFLITGDPVSAPPQMLGAELRERLTTLDAGPLAGLVYDGDKATVLMTGVVVEPEVIGLAVQVAVQAGAGAWAD